MKARSCAARILDRVIGGGRSLSDALPAGLQELDDIGQRALVQELCYGTLRWYFRLDTVLQRLLQKPLKRRDSDLRSLLLAGLYQLEYLGMPSHAAVNETVEAAQELGKLWAKGLVNGVLRAWLRRNEELREAIAQFPAARYAHPVWLIEQLQQDWPDSWQAVLAANNERPPFCLRVNQRRLTRPACLELMRIQGMIAAELAFTAHGIRLEKPVPVNEVPGFSAGLVSVQDGAAQLAPGLLALAPGQRVLDACAAPGGKTAHLLETEAKLEELTAVDIDERRLQRVAENLARLGLEATLVQGDAGAPQEWWDGRSYDRILLDVPCSATGVIRRHPDIKLLRRSTDMAVLTVQQAHLLRSIWPLLSTGGMLLYVTCSVMADENSRQISRFLAETDDAREAPINAEWGHACSHGRQILPGESDMDGFYFACLLKTAVPDE